MPIQKMFRSIVLSLCLGLIACSTSSAPADEVRTQATQNFLAEMERMNPRVPQLKGAIAQGADINARSNTGIFKGFPALHIAVWSSFKVVKLLADEGADLDVQDRNGDTAMAIAVESGMVETVNFLLDKGANPDIRNVNGRSVLGKARYTMTRAALGKAHKQQVQFIIDILKARGAAE